MSNKMIKYNQILFKNKKINNITWLKFKASNNKN